MRYLKQVATLKLQQERCNGCGMCVNVCPHAVLALSNGKAQILDADRCMECGACAKNCPFSALEVKAGVGCAYAILVGRLTGSEPSCGCSGDSCC